MGQSEFHVVKKRHNVNGHNAYHEQLKHNRSHTDEMIANVGVPIKSVVHYRDPTLLPGFIKVYGSNQIGRPGRYNNMPVFQERSNAYQKKVNNALKKASNAAIKYREFQEQVDRARLESILANLLGRNGAATLRKDLFPGPVKRNNLRRPFPGNAKRNNLRRPRN